MPQLIVVGFVVFLQWLRRKLNKNFYKRMRKSEIFAGILADVAFESEIDSERILSDSRTEEVVDARYLVIFLLLGNGFYPAMIAERMGLSARAVRSAISGFEARLANSAGLRLVCERLSRKWLA
nr:MAG TPA: chromosomal replication initiator protein [Caudoviricetes sp.]